MAIRKIKMKVSGSGSAGSASGSAFEPLPNSELLAIYFDFTSAPATMDTTVKSTGDSDVPALTVLTLTNVNSDGWYYPTVQQHDNTGSAVTGAYQPPVLTGGISIDIAQADAVTDEVVAWIFIRV